MQTYRTSVIYVTVKSKFHSFHIAWKMLCQLSERIVMKLQKIGNDVNVFTNLGILIGYLHDRCGRLYFILRRNFNNIFIE